MRWYVKVPLAAVILGVLVYWFGTDNVNKIGKNTAGVVANVTEYAKDATAQEPEEKRTTGPIKVFLNDDTKTVAVVMFDTATRRIFTPRCKQISFSPKENIEVVTATKTYADLKPLKSGPITFRLRPFPCG